MLPSGETNIGCVHAGETESLQSQMPKSQTSAEGLEDSLEAEL